MLVWLKVCVLIFIEPVSSVIYNGLLFSAFLQFNFSADPFTLQKFFVRTHKIFSTNVNFIDATKKMEQKRWNKKKKIVSNGFGQRDVNTIIFICFSYSSEPHTDTHTCVFSSLRAFSCFVCMRKKWLKYDLKRNNVSNIQKQRIRKKWYDVHEVIICVCTYNTLRL